MNKADLIDAIAARLSADKKVAAQAVEAVVDTIQRAVAKGEKVAITGFGVFEKLNRPARTARNPATGAKVRVKKTSVPKFRPGTQFKGVVSGAVKLAPAPAAKSAAASKKAAPAKKSAAASKKAAPAGKKAASKSTAKTASKAAGASTARKTTKSASKTTATKKATSTKAPARKSAAKKAPARKTTTKRAAKR